MCATLEPATGQNGLRLVRVLEHAEKERPRTPERAPEWANVLEFLLSSFRVWTECVPGFKSGASGNRAMRHAALGDNRGHESATDR
jgi:hypothetical protein